MQVAVTPSTTPRTCRRLRPRLAMLACALVVLACSCADRPDTDGVDTSPDCERVTAQWTRTFATVQILGVGRVSDACGEGLLATSQNWSVFSVGAASDPSPCVVGPWPEDMIADKVRNLASGGMLVSDETARRVVRVDADGPVEWFSEGSSSSATVVEADEGPCGHRFVLRDDHGSRILQHLGADGSVLWQRTGAFSSLAVACDAVYVGGTAVSKDQTSPMGIIDNDAWLARWTLSGNEQWRQAFSGEKDWTIAQVSLAGPGVGAELTRRNKYIGVQTLHQLVWFDAAGVARISVDIATETGVHNRSGDYPLRPQLWPADQIAWLGTSGVMGVSTCSNSVWVESWRPDGTPELIRTLRRGRVAGWTALKNGSLLIGGSGDCSLDDQPDWLMYLPACAAPP